MSDYASARAAGVAAIDELDAWQGQPTLSSQLAANVTLKAERDNALAAVAAMKIAAQADVAADAANLAGQGVLDAAAAKGL